MSPAAEHSWPGVPAPEPHASAFEPAAAPVGADSWNEPGTPSWEGDATVRGSGSPELQAEALLASGDLVGALRIYQEQAALRPEEPELWNRVAEIAGLLQARKGP